MLLPLCIAKLLLALTVGTEDDLSRIRQVCFHVLL